MQTGDLATAEGILALAENVCSHAASATLLQFIRHNRADILAIHGKYDEAMMIYKENEEHARNTHLRNGLWQPLLDQATLLQRHYGNVIAARDKAREALIILRSLSLPDLDKYIQEADGLASSET